MIEAMKQALEALETLARYENPSTKIQVRKKDSGSIVTIYPHKIASDAAVALHAALDAPKREWVGLTDEDKQIAFDDTQEASGGFWEFADAIEVKLKEKNT